MRTILVANPKGGAGKTTLATNLAGYLTNAGYNVALWDLDRQKSSLEWLAIRPDYLPPIARMDSKEGEAIKSKKNSWLVIDSPAGLHGKNLEQAVKLADKVVVPVQPSLFDMAATQDFLAQLREEKKLRNKGGAIGIVGMRVDPRTRAAATLAAHVTGYELPMLTYLRDTVTYANAAFNGQSVFDLPPYLGSQDTEQWGPIIRWLSE